MDSLKQCITKETQIDTSSIEVILSSFYTRDLKKGDFFLRAGKLCTQMAFIDTGYLRMFDIVDGKEVTFWIGSSGKFITSLSSFVFQTTNFWNIQAITDCKLHIIDRESHFTLCKQQPKWLEFDNHLLAHSFALLEQKILSQLHTSSQQRFDALFKADPQLFNHVPLQYIASMLGITPETLSRLRKKNAN
ncbi:Crp/Fnr family transcriptional regulator [Algibacter mikhailovii]|uniref:Cyclic nucleotide-binding protein n=1 Tax=Algibacter mikhailovii TaxID=425498 RepID=A0A918VBN9_9FLAO|nr:Crp/Fnr family transcriptional regulator [Algibacter mikhailovii]GGZ85969.1 cyclic nucleotide-binding protein [Algibacter mikhailovii]